MSGGATCLTLRVEYSSGDLSIILPTITSGKPLIVFNMSCRRGGARSGVLWVALPV